MYSEKSDHVSRDAPAVMSAWWLVGTLALVNVLAVVDRTLPAVLIE